MQTSQDNQWTSFQKLLFRFGFIYIGMFVIFQNNDAYPEWTKIIYYPMKAMHGLCQWIAKNIYNLPYELNVRPTGSADTTMDWTILLVCLVTAVAGSIIWTLIDRKRDNYKTLYYWLRVAVRFYVGLMLINYGLFKLFKTQFSYPHFNRLLQDYGDSSPMGLAWTFLGFSYGYNVFMGIAEVAAGLLLFRRTVVVGSIITLMASANVMAMNYFYDIPVKITSTHLVLLTLFLLLPNIKRLTNFFFLGKTETLEKEERPVFKNEKIGTFLTIAKYIIIALSIYGAVSLNLRYINMGRNQFRKAPAYEGVYNVDEFTVNGKEYTHYKDSVRWSKVIVSPWFFAIEKQNKKREFYNYEHDDDNKQFLLTGRRDTSIQKVLRYNEIDKIVHLDMIYEGDTTKATSKLKTKKDFNLTGGKFRWISERPYNR